MAHTANDAVDVIDVHRDKYIRSIPDLPGVAGVLVSNETDLVFTSNRGRKPSEFSLTPEKETSRKLW